MSRWVSLGEERKNKQKEVGNSCPGSNQGDLYWDWGRNQTLTDFKDTGRVSTPEGKRD